jgi:hypothetical protein
MKKVNTGLGLRRRIIKLRKNIIPTEIRTRVAGLEGRNLNHTNLMGKRTE